ncbi:T9SS type A sorting domain-containing protein [Tenacibaculum aquimarinum]|uniref:T9SS type A sorting domain-containing protein n=1 Tax=Tenacibaculum aquimarinum TaxID=2910675 RepID=UPI001F0A9572|nr:T9SS type A sorting domain-containing protein [Tenacibaculum aquimarinum]MCH3884267.1 T9SS type A sorting domain-containing protein [Tenacibaculum aquimarinum]
MKQKYFLKFILLMAIGVFTSFNMSAQGLENFNNSAATASYLSNSFTGNNGIVWSYVASRDENGDDNDAGIDGNALMLRRSSDNSAVSATGIPNGIGDFSVTLYKGFTGNGNRQVELFINGVSKGTSVAFDDADDKDKYTFSVSGINIDGAFDLEIRNVTSKQVIVDDITWSEFGAALSTDSFNKLDVNVYPNPVTNGEVFIKSSNGEEKNVEVYNILGRRLISTKVNANDKLDVSNLNAGIYLLKINEGEKQLTKKIVIK